MRSLVRAQLKTRIIRSEFVNDLKLSISYVLYNKFYKYLVLRSEKSNNISVVFKNNKNYYFLLHARLSTNFFVHQLVDMFTYETVVRCSSGTPRGSSFHNNFILVYNLHNLFSNNRVFVFTRVLLQADLYPAAATATKLFANTNWLEREIAELCGVHFFLKKDLRNLMLQYGDASTPLKKSFPSIGFRETTYDIASDSVIQANLDLQN